MEIKNPNDKQAFASNNSSPPQKLGEERIEHIDSTQLHGITHAEQCHATTSGFDLEAEARLRRKIDWYIVPTVSILYLFCFIDRANIGNARLAGFEANLGLTGYDYNTILSIFYVSYIFFELPSNMACKWLGPGWFIPLITLGFGIATICFAYVDSFNSACGVRFVLGMFEAGMLPGIAYYLSRWYRRDELSFRLSLYIVMSSLAGAFGGLLASGILTLDSFLGRRRWQMIFLIEGIVTVVLAIISFFTLTDRPDTAVWLTAEEKELAAARVKSERVGTSEVLDKFTTRKVIAGIWNPVTLASAFIFLLGNVTVQGLAFFAPTIVRSIYPKNSVVSNQLYTVPPYILGGICIVSVSFASWRFGRRNIFLTLSAPPIIVGYTIFLATSNPQARYGATYLIVIGAFNSGALCNAQVSANTISDTARASAIATVVMFGNTGGLIASWSFLPFDGPNYKIGNGLNLATSSTMLVVALVIGRWMAKDNKTRDKKSITAAGPDVLADEVENMDWRHPEFRWKP